MEKFGLFNILSALGKLSEENSQTKREDVPQGATPAPAQQSAAPVKAQGVFSNEERMNKMLSVMERHEQISRRIEKGRR